MVTEKTAPQRKEFVEPTTIAEAQERLDTLSVETAQIQLQVGNDNVADINGNRIPYDDWYDWRRRALYALEAKRADMRRLKRWIKDARGNVPISWEDADRLGFLTPEQMLKGMFYLEKISEILQVGINPGRLRPEEMTLCNEARDFVTSLREHVPASISRIDH